MIHRLPNKIKQNKPIYTGFSILEISKAHMYRFHYDVVLAKYGLDCRLLFTDTDSFCYHIKTDDVYIVCPTVCDALQVVNELGVLFSSSITARSAFSKITDFSEGPVKQPRPLCPTRWLVRVNAVQTVLSQYDAVLQWLDELGAP